MKKHNNVAFVIVSVLGLLAIVCLCVGLKGTWNNVNAETTAYQSVITKLVIEALTTTELTTQTISTTIESTTQKMFFDMGKFKLTAYCPCYDCSEEYGNMTATGVIAEEGRTIAVDPNVIPYGSEVLINGNIYIAEDTGGAVIGKHIDIYFESHNVC